MNLYEILGIKKNASQDDIKKSYRNLSKKHHPDKGGNGEKFNEINGAYMVLVDPQKRKHYDETGDIPKDNEQGRINTELVNLFFIVIQSKGDNIKYVDIFKEMLNMIGKKINEITNHKENLVKEVLKFQDIKTRTTGKFFQDIIENKILDINKQINHSNSEIEVMNKMIKFIEDGNFQFKTDENNNMYSYNIPHIFLNNFNPVNL